jgi:hypothetical protein
VIRIEVKKELGGEVVTREHGKRLRELILKGWADPPVVVDGEGLRRLSEARKRAPNKG